MALVDLSDLTGENLVKRLLQIDQANYSALDGLADYLGNDVTDLIIDEGSNSDGNWIRFANGIQICTAFDSLTLDITVSSDTSSGYFRSAGQNYSFAQNFNTLFGAYVSGYSGNKRNIIANHHEDLSLPDQRWTVYFILPESVSSVSVRVHLLAIGTY